MIMLIKHTVEAKTKKNKKKQSSFWEFYVRQTFHITAIVTVSFRDENEHLTFFFGYFSLV
jgi:hypothetical protein